jgi:hypothetical protein
MSELASESMWGTEGPTEEARGGYALSMWGTEGPTEEARGGYALSQRPREAPPEPRGTVAGGAGGVGKHSEGVR